MKRKKNTRECSDFYKYGIDAGTASAENLEGFRSIKLLYSYNVYVSITFSIQACFCNSQDTQ